MNIALLSTRPARIPNSEPNVSLANSSGDRSQPLIRRRTNVLSPYLTHCCKLFVVRRKLKPFVIKQIRTLWQKHLGVWVLGRPGRYCTPIFRQTLFSTHCELLFPQTLSIHIHTNCRGGGTLVLHPNHQDKTYDPLLCPPPSLWHPITSVTLMPHSPVLTPGVSHGQLLRVGCLALALCAAAAGTSAQQTGEPGQAPPPVRLLTATDGRKIAAAALGQDETSRGAQDCSHLVHQIYSDAGYEYSYASSFDLYAGHGSFRRVRHAQPGDLVTWPGHVGIVVNPARHRFYSLVRSGLQTEDYLGPYWRSRGRPRFYRYILGTGAEIRTAKATRSSPSNSSSADRNNSPATATRTSSERANPNQTVSEAALRSKMIATPPGPASDLATESVPSTILITPAQRRPTPEEALDGISELSNASAAVLRTAEPLNVRIPVVVFDDIHVDRIEIKRDKGWAHLQINSHVRIASDGTDFKRRREKVRWELRRDASGWTAIAPAEHAYVARDVAVRALAAQLAEMTQSEAAAQHQESIIGQEARIANLLSALLQD